LPATPEARKIEIDFSDGEVLTETCRAIPGAILRRSFVLQVENGGRLSLRAASSACLRAEMSVLIFEPTGEFAPGYSARWSNGWQA